MEEKLRKTGIDLIGDVSWGTHFCQFYQTKEDLIDILVPYFKAGLENNEFCMWVTSDPLCEQEAKEALQGVVPDIDGYLKQGQIEIIPYTEWYTKGDNFDSKRVLNSWVEKLNQALEKGYDGLRLTGNTFWLEKEDWNDFVDYEEEVNNVIGEYQMIALCTYSLDKCNAAEIIDVVNNHEFALIMREGKWELIESSEHKRMEEELQESKRRYQQFFDNPLNAFALCEIITDDKGEPVNFVYLEVNNAFEDFTGLKRENILNKKVTDVLPPEEVAELIKIYGNVALTGKSANFEYTIPSLSKYYDVVAFSPQKMRFIAFFTDVTEGKKAEEEIERHDKLLEGINRVFQEALTTETEEEVAGKCLEVAESLTGSEFGFLSEINPDGCLDTLAISPLAWKSLKIPPEKANKMANNIEIASYWGRTVKEEKSQIVNDPEFDVDRRGFPEGHPKITSFLGVPLKQSNNTIGMIALANKEGGYTTEDVENIEALSVAFVEALMRKRAEIGIKKSYDVLEEKVEERTAELEEACSSLKETTDELKRSNDELQSFAYVVSHDLQEPLRTIASFTQLLQRRYEGKLDSDADEFIDYVVEATKRMQQMIHDLLDYSRIMTKGKEFEEVNSENVLNGVIRSLKTIIDENNAVIIHDELPVIIADEGQIRRVFQNLIVNAIKFRKPDESPRIHISACKDEKREEYVFSVSDNGIGIEKQYFDRIFAIFQRLHTREEYEGTGIGLSLVKRIIERHGGHIWVESEYGKGSTFYFIIPSIMVE